MQYKWVGCPLHKEEKIYVWHQIYKIMTNCHITTILEGFGYELQKRDIHTNTIGMEPRGPHVQRMHLCRISTRVMIEEEVSMENDYDQE